MLDFIVKRSFELCVKDSPIYQELELLSQIVKQNNPDSLNLLFRLIAVMMGVSRLCTAFELQEE